MELWNIFKRRQNGLKTFNEEQNNLLKFILNNRYFNIWKNEKPTNTDLDKYSLWSESRLEIYLTSTCNQHCEYCYLVKYGDKLYPQETNNKGNILKNLNILFDWIIENDMFIPEIEYFSGEVWHTQFGLDVLELTYQKLLNGLQTNQVLIPSNCSFLLDEIQTQKIQKYINKFRQIGINLQFSISVDGAIIENKSRPLNNKIEKTNEFYERMFLFAVHNNYYFHPMISSSNVKYWKENYLWWEQMSEKYDFKTPKETVMMLEVRNNDWTDETIEQYCDFIRFLMDKDRIAFSGNNEEYAYNLLTPVDVGCSGYYPYALPEADTFAGCTVCNSLTIRAGDLAICPCHRTAYSQFIYGYFMVKDNKIIDIKAENVNMAIRILLANNKLCHFKCDTCVFNFFCLKGCFGSQLETTGDPFMPIPCVCKLEQEKIKTIIEKYEEFEVLKYWKTITPYAPRYWQIKRIIDQIERIEKDYGMGKQ